MTMFDARFGHPYSRQQLTTVLRTGVALAVAMVTQVYLRAGIADLRITEVDPATGEVEVTHTASTAFTTSSALPFCHRLNYSSVVPANTTFGPGESRSFVVAGLNRLDSDLWLYDPIQLTLSRGESRTPVLRCIDNNRHLRGDSLEPCPDGGGPV